MGVNGVILAKCGGFWVSLYVRLLKESVGEGSRKMAIGCVREEKNYQKNVLYTFTL